MKEDTVRTIINRKNEYLIIRFTNSPNGSKKKNKAKTKQNKERKRKKTERTNYFNSIKKQ